jgi:thioredoxin reductase (NADPH)
MSPTDAHQISIIGGGLAGLAGAVHAAESGASVVCFEAAPLFGGLVANIGVLDDWPSPQPVSGVSIAEYLLGRARELSVTFVPEKVTALASAGDEFAITAGAMTYDTRIAIVASGARLRQLGVPGEAELAGRGVSQCDWCDGGLYRNKRVAVVGGGDAALQAALHLASLCQSVTVIARGATLRARRHYVLRAADNPKIEFLWETQVDRVVGSEGVQGLSLTSLPDNARSEQPFDGVFVFPGVVPNLDFAPSSLDRDEAGFAVTDARYVSSIPGLFVVGAARSGNGGSLLSAMGEAMTAAGAAVADLRHADLL